VIETDSPRSRTLVMDTFPTSLSRTGLTSFQVSGSPVHDLHSVQVSTHLAPFPFQWIDPLLPFPLCQAFLGSLDGRNSVEYYESSVAVRFLGV
jgi:hypothetical protein